MDCSELDGRTYKCLDGCALCCLCQPELLPEEERSFRADPLLRGVVSTKHISPDVKGAAIRLQGSYGGCALLKDRRCTQYDRRPHFCRTFPLSVFAGWRIQLNANLSCRGMDLPGESLTHLGRRILAQHGEETIQRELRASSKVFLEFARNTKDTKTAQSITSVRGAAAVLLDDMTDRLGLSRVLTHAAEGRTKQNSTASELARHARMEEPEADIDDLGTIIGTELFDLPDLSYLPVYVDISLDWRIFRLEGLKIVGYELRENGSVEELLRIDPAGIELLPMSKEGRAKMQEYLKLTNSRDCFLGHAAYLSDMEGYEYNFGQVYLGAMANSAVDLWWRSSFLAAIAGQKELGPSEVGEGVIFLDMDMLDQPTIGAFI